MLEEKKKWKGKELVAYVQAQMLEILAEEKNAFMKMHRISSTLLSPPTSFQPNSEPFLPHSDQIPSQFCPHFNFIPVNSMSILIQFKYILMVQNIFVNYHHHLHHHHLHHCFLHFPFSYSASPRHILCDKRA